MLINPPVSALAAYLYLTVQQVDGKSSPRPTLGADSGELKVAM